MSSNTRPPVDVTKYASKNFQKRQKGWFHKRDLQCDQIHITFGPRLEAAAGLHPGQHQRLTDNQKAVLIANAEKALRNLPVGAADYESQTRNYYTSRWRERTRMREMEIGQIMEAAIGLYEDWEFDSQAKFLKGDEDVMREMRILEAAMQFHEE